MRARVDNTKCSGIGLCEATAPNVFAVRDDGQSHVIKAEVTQSEQAAVEEAVNGCPTGALSLQD